MHLVIVGNGVAGITAAMAVRAKDPQADITIISGESEYFFSRTALMYAFMDVMQRRDLEPYERKVFREQRLALRHDWVVDLDANARQLRLQGGATVNYDQLLLATGSRGRRAPWERDLTGVVRFVTLQDLDACERLTPGTRRAVVAGGGLIGVELVECLVHHRVPVTFLVREPSYWPAALSPEEGDLVAAHIRAQGVDLKLATEVQSLQGENRVTGVTTTAGESIPCELLGVTIGVEPNIDWLRTVKTPPALNRGILTDPAFRTSLPGVFAAGDVAEVAGRIEPLWYAAKRQGEAAARSILGESVAYAPPTYYNSAKFFHLEWTCAGETKGPGRFRKLPGREASVRVIERDGIAVGFSMLGTRWNHRVLSKWVEQRRRVDEVMGLLSEAQYDVEFGKVAL
jgi:NADPH-dependent 2,4-dienoyl-CoA reductase/sulfur reductase-like enzyme